MFGKMLVKLIAGLGCLVSIQALLKVQHQIYGNLGEKGPIMVPKEGSMMEKKIEGEKENKPVRQPYSNDVKGVNACPIHSEEFVIINTMVPRCEAEAICHVLGMHLANIDNSNFMQISNMAFQCVGANSQSWIDDWNGDKYQGTCLVLSTGSNALGGTIDAPKCCAEKLPVICQKKPCAHPFIPYDCERCYERSHHRDCNNSNRHDNRRHHVAFRVTKGSSGFRRDEFLGCPIDGKQSKQPPNYRFHADKKETHIEDDFEEASDGELVNDEKQECY